MAEINLDTAKAARLERLKRRAVKPHKVVFGEEKFTLPLEIPVDFGVFLNNNRPVEALRALLGEKAAAKFFAHNPSQDDIIELANQVGRVYGLGGDDDAGEASEESGSSPGSSRSTSKRSRRTSSGSTGSTSETPAGEESA